MSAFGKLAGAVAGGFGDAQKERERREMAQLQHAQLLAALSEQGYGMGEAPADPGTELLSGQGVDEAVSAATGGLSIGQQAAKRKRYETVAPGKHGLYRDVTRTPDARRQRAEEVVAQRQEERDRRTMERQTALEQIKAKNQRKPQQHIVDPVTGKVSFFDPENPPADLKVNPQPRDAFSFPVVAGPDGTPVVARANTKTGAIERTDVAGKPTAATTKLTEPQEKSHLFYKLMESAEPQIEAAMRSGQVRKAAVSAYMLSPDMAKPLAQAGLNAQEQSLIRSFKDFAAGVLRKESGAAVTTGELREVWERYGPGFGDNPALDEEKSTARKSYMGTMKQQAGPALKFYEHQSGGHASRAQQLWDAAVAKHGQAKVLEEFGPRPQE